MSERVELEPAYVLHGRLYRETSLLLDCFTQNHGRVSILAKGARRPKSASKGLLQPFKPLLVSFVGRGELKTLTHVELHGPIVNLQGERLTCGLYLNEVLARLMHPQAPSPEVFDVYASALVSLGTGEHFHSALRLFEKHLLLGLGYELILSHDVDGQPIEADALYQYHPETGAVQSLPSRTQKLIRGQTLIDLADDDLSDPQSCLESKMILKSSLARLLGDKPLHSRSLIRVKSSKEV